MEIQRLNTILSRTRSENVQLTKEKEELLRDQEEHEEEILKSKMFSVKSVHALNYSYEKALRQGELLKQ